MLRLAWKINENSVEFNLESKAQYAQNTTSYWLIPTLFLKTHQNLLYCRQMILKISNLFFRDVFSTIHVGSYVSSAALVTHTRVCFPAFIYVSSIQRIIFRISLVQFRCFQAHWSRVTRFASEIDDFFRAIRRKRPSFWRAFRIDDSNTFQFKLIATFWYDIRLIFFDERIKRISSRRWNVVIKALRSHRCFWEVNRCCFAYCTWHCEILRCAAILEEFQSIFKIVYIWSRWSLVNSVRLEVDDTFIMWFAEAMLICWSSVLYNIRSWKLLVF